MNHHGNNGHLAVFARYPIPGHSKTRLIPRLGPDGASSFARAGLIDTLHLFSALPCCQRTLFYTPSTAHADIIRLLAEEQLESVWSVEPQTDSTDLGDRLAAAARYLSHCNPRPPTPIALIGMDCFELTVSMVRDSMDLVSRTRGLAHIIPAVDGGYVLLTVPEGCEWAEVFGGIPWSSEYTGQTQVQRIEGAGLRCTVGEMLGDVDEPGDLERLWESRGLKMARFPRTMEFLEGVMEKQIQTKC